MSLELDLPGAHVRFTTRELERPRDAARMGELLALTDARRLLLYASGTGAEDGTPMLATLDDAGRAAVRAGSAERFLRL